MIRSTEIFVGLFSHRMSLGVMCCISLYSWRCVYTLVPAVRPHCLAHGLAWFCGPESTRSCHWGCLPLALGQGDTGQGEEKKNPSPPHPAPTKMNKNWKTTCKVHLIQEHLQYADVFFCTLCLLNCLWLRASVMKLYVLVERAASPFQLGPGLSLLSRFCETFFPNTCPYE